MSKECLKNCPRIEAARRATSFVSSNPMSVDIFTFAVNHGSFRILEDAIKASENCPGPVEEVIDVARGIIHKRVVQKTVWRCGLDQQPTLTTAFQELVGTKA